jgi:hypothetical protein
MNAYGGAGVYIHTFLNLALIGEEWSDLHLDSFTARENILVRIG